MEKEKRNKLVFLCIAVLFLMSGIVFMKVNNITFQQLSQGDLENKGNVNQPEQSVENNYDIKVSESEESRYLYPYATWDSYYGEGVGYHIGFPRTWQALKIKNMQSQHSSGLRLISPQTLEGIVDPSLNNYENVLEDISVYYFDSISQETINKTRGYHATALDELIAKEGSKKMKETQISKKIKETEVIKKGKMDTYVIYFQKGQWLYEISFNYRTCKEALTDTERQILYSFTPNLDASEAISTWGKPVIYLYSQKPQNVSVKLHFDGALIATYPSYNNGWNVFAYPDGKLINSSDGKEYSYLFWEGEYDKYINYDLSNGFVVEGKDTATFLQDTLSKMGLSPKEYNEFIVYWMPKMQNNKYNLIHFASKEEYDDYARLAIEPEPDSILRIFMVYKPLESKQEIQSQEIKPFKRNGFTVVEWGGTEIK